MPEQSPFPELKCSVCKRVISHTLDLQSILMGVCSGVCAKAAGITDEQSRLLYAAWDRLNPYWDVFRKMRRISP